MTIYSFLKVLSMVATGVFGVFGVLGDEKEDEGKKKKRKKIAIAGILISAALSVVLYKMEAEAAEKQFTETTQRLDKALQDTKNLISGQQTSLKNAQVLQDSLDKSANAIKAIKEDNQGIEKSQIASLRAQQDLQTSEDRLHRYEIRKALPLTPITITFERTFSMDMPELKPYVAKLWSKLQKTFDENPYIKHMVPLDMNQEFSRQNHLYPDPEEDYSAYEVLQGGSLDFIFYARDVRHEVASFNCLPTGDVMLGDFVNNRIREVSTCDFTTTSPYETLSSLDLIGKKLTWVYLKSKWVTSSLSSTYPFPLPFKLDSVRLRFSYDPHNEILLEVPAGSSKIDLTAEDLELSRFLALMRNVSGTPHP